MATSMWDEMLYKAARDGDLEKLQVAFNRGGRVDWQNWIESSNTCLHVASLKGHTAVIVWLISRQSPVNVCNKYFQNTPLHYACAKGHTEAVSILLQHGADANATDKDGNTPMHWASSQFDVDSLKWLITCNGQVNALNEAGETPLHFASQYGHTANILLLCKYGADLNVADKKYGYTPLHYACKGGFVACVEALLRHEANVCAESLEKQTPLHRAAWAGRTDVVQVLIKHNANINAIDAGGDTPLHDAAMRNHYSTVEALLHGGADINIKNRNNPPMTPREVARSRNFKKTLQTFHDVGVVKSGRWSAKVRMLKSKSYQRRLNWEKIMIQSIEDGNLNNVQKSIEKGASVNCVVKSYFCWTPLHYASAYGQLDIAKFLFKHGAGIDAREDDGNHIIHTAVFSGHLNVIRWLVENLEVDVDTKNLDHMTPLHYAAQMNRLEIVRYLLIHDATIDAESENRVKMNEKETRALMMTFTKAKRDEIKDHLIPYDDFGFTPLHIAAKFGHTKLAHRLVQWGADVNKVDHHGETALHIAAKNGMLKTTIRLLGLGADPRKHSRRGKLPIFVAREHFRESCAMEIEKWELFVIKMIEHKTADPFYIALTVAGLESYYGILAIELGCHDMRSFTDPVLMPLTRLSPLGFRAVELRRITRIAKNTSLGRPLKIVFSDNRILSLLPIMMTYGYMFEYDCVELGGEVFDFLNPVLKRELKRVHEKAREADKEIIDVKRKAIEDFWSGAQGKGEELASAQRYAAQRNKDETYLDRPVGYHESDAAKLPTQKQPHTQPIRPEADSNIPRPSTTSPRHQRLMEQNVQMKE